MTISIEQTADDLDAAADYIHVHGWCQGNLLDEDGQVCAEGAIIIGITLTEKLWLCDVTGSTSEWLAKAQEKEPELYLRYAGRIRAAARALARHVEDVTVFHWNDGGSMTRDAVTDAIRRCAKDLREKAGAGE